ncbi:MAG: VWA domain-containing protein [Clostridia bacterium]|nr:VWA domain-containing protein [Clostridia bacterium]
MSGLHVTFIYPWLLLLLLPAAALVLIPYFLVAKKYRRTRNRIAGIVLSLTVMTFAILALSGMRFEYYIANDSNEIILLVDLSDTEEQSAEDRDQFVEEVISQSKSGNFKIGVVTFGFDQVYAVPMTYDTKDVFDNYLAAEKPDVSATNVEAALLYAAGLFTHPETGKIVLVTDGKETDGKAVSVVRTIRSSGIRVDVAEVPSSYEGEYVGIVDVEKPDHHVSVDEEVAFAAKLISTSATQATITLSDNDEIVLTEQVDLVEGENTVQLSALFRTDGVHELVTKVEVNEDSVKENSVYHTYVLIEKFNKVLILERNDGESDALKELLEENEEFEVDVLNVLEEEEEAVFRTVDQLRAYDQVVLCNISNADLPEGMAKNLHDYVNVYGGGVFTVGGDKDPDASNPDPNAYSRSDLYGSILQRMLPVQAIDYTPPLGVIIIVDTSGSMASKDGGSPLTRLEWAVEGARSALMTLSERDYFGLMTLDDDYDTILPLTPRTRETMIRNAIEELDTALGGTVFPGAIERAGAELRALKSVDKKHILIVTDGEVPEEQREEYESFINHYYTEDNITLSVAMINSGNAEAENQMRRAVEIGHGRFFVIKDTSSQLVSSMRDDLQVDEIKDVEYKTFNPTIASLTSPLVKDLPRNIAEGKADQLDVTLDGFYGVKARPNAELILKGEFEVPVYAQWKYGAGMVGSLMVDVAGRFASDFTSSDTGRTFIKNVVRNLMPDESIRPSEINVNLREENYINNMSVFAALGEGEKVEGYIENVASGERTSLNAAGEADSSAPVYVSGALGADNGYTRASFVIKESGVYKIILSKINDEGVASSATEIYKQFSYSKEYDVTAFSDAESIAAALDTVAERGSGAHITDLEEYFRVFDGFVTVLDRVFDPTLILAITSIVLFLLEICVRKFKFKWIHEIIKERKEKRFGQTK